MPIECVQLQRRCTYGLVGRSLRAPLRLCLSRIVHVSSVSHRKLRTWYVREISQVPPVYTPLRHPLNSLKPRPPRPTSRPPSSSAVRVQEAKGNPLTFLIVLDAGHMVPLDHPRAALDMISRFLQGVPFSDHTQNRLGTLPCRSGAGVGGGGECYDFGPGANDAVGAGEDSSALVAALTHAAAATPPKIEGTPAVGQDFAIVTFSGVENAKDAKSEWEIEYEVCAHGDNFILAECALYDFDRTGVLHI